MFPGIVLLAVSNFNIACIVIAVFFTLLYVVAWGRELFLRKKEVYRDLRTSNLKTGKEVFESILSEIDAKKVSVELKDSTVSRYYFNPRKNKVVMSTFAYYSTDYYDIMRSATLAYHVIQRERAVGLIDFYLWIAPFMEIWIRIFPLVIYACFILTAFYQVFALCLLLFLYLMTVFVALLMRHIDKDASEKSCQWLLGHGVVEEKDRKPLEKVARYVANFNLICALSSGLALLTIRGKVYSQSTV